MKKEGEFRPQPRLMLQMTFDRMSKRLEELEGKRAEVKKGMREAAGRPGQWHDSFALEEAQRQEGIFRRLVIDLKSKLNFVEIIESRRNVETVGIGNTIKLRFEDGNEEEFTILGPDDYVYGNNPSWIPFTSPVAKAIMNHKIGDRVTYEVEKKNHGVEILEIKPGELE